MGVYLMGVYLMGVYLMSLRLTRRASSVRQSRAAGLRPMGQAGRLLRRGLRLSQL
jgi:hypothetical protein